MTAYGIVLAKDVMVEMRDGIRLASDIYRPARDGQLVDGRFPTILLRTPYDKTDRRYVEIADFFTPRGYAVVLQDMRDRYRSEGTGDYYHVVTPHTGEDGYDTVEWIATQPWSNGRIGTVGSSYAGITQVRAALERPPHLTAIWPDVVPTNSFHNQSREGGAMQQHMFWALFIHAQDAQDIADDPAKQADVWNDLRDLRQLFRAGPPWERGSTSLRHVPPLEQTLIDYSTRGAYDEFWQRVENDFTRHWDQHADVPGTYSTGWYDPFPAADSEYFAAMAAQERVAAAARDRPVEPRRHARRRDVLPRRRLRPGERLGRAAVLRGAARVLLALAPGRRDGAARRRGAGADLRHGRRQRAQDGRGEARPRRPVARGAGVAARARACRPRSTCSPTAGWQRSRHLPGRSRGATPSIRRTRCRRSAACTARSGSCRPRARGWSRPGRASSTPSCGCATS